MKKKIEEYSSKELFELANAKKKQEDAHFTEFKMFKCYNPACGKTSRLNKWSRVYNYYYEDCPYTPKWLYDGEMRLICPKCNFLNRILNKTYYNYGRERTETIDHQLKKEVTSYFDKGGRIKDEYIQYDDDIYIVTKWQEIWNPNCREKISTKPYKDWINVPDKI